MNNLPLNLVALDESSAGPFVTSGAVWLPKSRFQHVGSAIEAVKHRYGLPVHAEVHCRILFAGDARRKSEFSHLSPGSIIPFIQNIVVAARQNGCVWHGMRCDANKYPSTFRLPIQEGSKQYVVTHKHIAAIMATGLPFLVGTIHGEDYSLIFDKDSTKLDWGLARKTQASHFAMIDAKAVKIRTSISCCWSSPIWQHMSMDVDF